MTHRTHYPVIGIIGDGQLALMLADVLIKSGQPFRAFSTSDNSPMALLYPEQTTQDLKSFRESADVFTLENEFFSVSELETMLATKQDHLFPELASYRHFSDKISQHRLYDALEIPSPRWMEIKDSDLTKIFSNGFSFPFIIKAPAGGYDGKGVRVVRNPSEFNSAADAFGLYEGKTLLLEEMVSIKKELAQGFLRASDGTFTILPLVETVQVNGICQYVYYPAPVDETISKQIETIIQRLIHAPLTGIFNFEFFLDEKGKIFINEGAPRPHNSQHLTIDASTDSQFILLAKYLSGVKNIPETVTTKTSAMVNILGKSQGSDYKLILPEIDHNISVHTKLYGKEKCSPGRKLGHVNLVDSQSSVDLRELALKVFKEYHI